MKEDDQQAAGAAPASGSPEGPAKEAEPLESLMPHDPSSTAGRDAFGDVTDFGIQEDADDPEQHAESHG